MKTRMGLVTLVVATVLVLTCCAPQTPSTPEPGSDEPAEETTQEDVTLTVWTCWNPGERYEEWYNLLAKGFEDETGVKVDLYFNGRDNQTKLRTALGGGTRVDLMDQDAYQVAGGMVADGMGYAVDEWLDEDAWGEDAGPLRDIFYQGLLDQYMLDGKTYLIPHTLITIAFWYDQRHFEAAGIDGPPETWQEFLDDCQKLKETGVAPIALDPHPMYTSFYFYHLVERIKGPGFLLSAVEDETGEKWGDPVFLQVAQMERELWDKGYIIEGAEGFTWPQGQMTMAEGASAMELCGSWLFNEIKDASDPDFEHGGFPFPAVEGGDGARTDMEAYMMSFMIPKDAPHPREAFDFIRYALSKKNQELLADLTANAAARKDVPWPPMISDGQEMFANATTTFDAYDGMATFHAEYYSNIFLPVHNEMFLGEITPERFIEKMKAETKGYWERQ